MSSIQIFIQQLIIEYFLCTGPCSGVTNNGRNIVKSMLFLSLYFNGERWTNGKLRQYVR